MSINQRQRGDQGKKEWDGESPSIPPSVALSRSFAFFLCVSFPAPKLSLHLPSLRTTRLAPRLDYFQCLLPFFHLFIFSCLLSALFFLCFVCFLPRNKMALCFYLLLPPPSILPVLIKTVPAASQ